MNGKNSVHLELSSNYELTDLVQAVSDELSGMLGFSDDDGHWIGMAIREAVNNAIKHGNRQDPQKKVALAAALRVFDSFMDRRSIMLDHAALRSKLGLPEPSSD